MDKKELSEKELKIMEEIARNRGVTQRELSRKAGVSLGMVNMSLKKLARKGYVKVKGMNKRSLEYVLTPKGFSQKAKKSYRYFRKTLVSLKSMKKKIQALILTEYSKGGRSFIVLGDGELADIVEMSFRDLALGDVRYKRVRDERKLQAKDFVVLATREKYKSPSGAKRWINVMEKLSQ